jgi:nucleoside-diphosphate-sugar epimerase
MPHFDIDDLEFIDKNLGTDVERFKGANILITGSTGFVGKGLLETFFWLDEIYALGLKITSISRDPESFFLKNPHFKKFSQFRLIRGNISEKIIDLDIGSIDYVVHAATDVVGKSLPLDVFNSCVKGTKNVIDLAKLRNCKSFLLVSSGAVYGQQPSNISKLPESYIGGVDLSSPKSAYALGKQASEWILHQNASEAMEVKVIRGFAFTGPYLPLDQHFAIGNFIGAALQNRSIDILGDGTSLRTYLYSTELCLWLLKVLLKGKSQGIWNIGGEEQVSIAELAFLVKDVLNSRSNISIIGKPGGRIEKYIPCIDKISRELGLFPSVDLKNAITKTANWNLRYGDI